MTGRHAPLEERFWRRIVGTEPTESGCIEWPGARNDNGYGVINDRGTFWYVHRVAFIIANGEIPDGKWVLHRCDNPPCVNENHLFLGDVRLNVKDMIAKGRENHGNPPRGSRHPLAKATEESMAEGKRRHRAGGETITAIALDLGIPRKSLSRAINGHAWPHVQ